MNREGAELPLFLLKELLSPSWGTASCLEQVEEGKERVHSLRNCFLLPVCILCLESKGPSLAQHREQDQDLGTTSRSYVTKQSKSKGSRSVGRSFSSGRSERIDGGLSGQPGWVKRIQVPNTRAQVLSQRKPWVSAGKLVATTVTREARGRGP